MTTPRLPLSDIHRAYLNDSAVTDEVIEAAGIYSEGDFICFPWRDGELLTVQRRPWPEPEGGLPILPGEKKPRKYQWPNGAHLHFGAWRPMRDDGSPVVIAEGTKQSLCVASWMPPEWSVYGMPGCDGWRNLKLTRLHRFEDRDVFVLLDGDAADNLRVYEAGAKLAEHLELEGARPKFAVSPAAGKDGIDDVLKVVEPNRRTRKLTAIIDRAKDSPASRKPRPEITGPGGPPDTGGLPWVAVNKNRRDVIHEILTCMKGAWDGKELFCYGGVLTRLREAVTDPLDKDSLVRWMCEAVATYRYIPPSAASPGRFEAAWPEPITIGALLASGDEFVRLDRVSRTPFARPDGTICDKQGYDSGTRTILITGNSGMDRLSVPESPTQDEARQAARLLLDTWLSDMPWRDDASRANALALVLTPFIRGTVPLVPLAVVSGLQIGVGKNLLADCISLMTSGENLQPLPWIADDDDEMRKQILSSFRAGSSLVCFDEAHVIGGASLTRAITAITYADRILGVSKMASYPNRVTWLALGNQVSVLADMARRAYFIELYPQAPDPQDRPESAFSIPDLRTWTQGNRPELVTAALTIIRAWYVAGQPPQSRGALMGSFETWDKMMSGILAWAGVDGFLDNLIKRRVERDTTGGYWDEHLAWLRSVFGYGQFTALDVQTKARASAGGWDAPPLLDEPDSKGFTRNLGAAYGRNQERWYGRLRIVKAGVGHGTKVRWLVEERDAEATQNDLNHPSHPSPEIETQPDLGGMDQGWMNDTVPGIGGVQNPQGGLQNEGTQPDLGTFDPSVNGNSVFPAQSGQDGWDGWDGSTTPGVARARSGAHTRTYTRAHTREDGKPSNSSHPSTPPVFAKSSVLVFDLETASADELFTYTQRDETGFVRLAGVSGASGVSMVLTAPELIPLLNAADQISGHNILGFDLLALARHCGADYDRLAAKAVDTELVERQANPPRSRESGASLDAYGLDAVAQRLGVAGKTDDAKRLARKHGGWDMIPLDDTEYRSYLEGDLAASTAVLAEMGRRYPPDPYVDREHQLAAIAGRMTLNGFLVDQELLAQRLAQGQAKKREALQILHDGWGLPLTRTVLRGRGENKTATEQDVTSPLSTDAGRAWLERLWEQAGLTDPPRTAKAQKLSIGMDDLKAIEARRPDLAVLCRLMAIVTGTRTVFQTASDCLAPDGRVHPGISFRQASGRWSVVNPGLTVFGKRGGRHHERDIFLPDEGHVLLSFDLSQVDMRAMAAHSQDSNYMTLFAPGRDAHQEIADQVGLDRQSAKAIGHGWNYGLGAKRMISNGLDPGKVTTFIAGMEARFPQLIAWRETIRAAGTAGEILNNGFGRRMRCDPARAYTVAPALLGQGGARDIMCESILRMPRELDKYLRTMVHDEVLLSVPKDIVRDVIPVVAAAMTWEWRGVPITCDLSLGASWGECSAK